MDNKKKTILILVILVILFAAAFFGYRTLSAKYQEAQNPGQQSGQSGSEDMQEQSYNGDLAVQPGEGSQSASEEASQESDIVSDTIQREKLELAADFTMEDSEGESVRLTDHYGKPVIVNFWATWCPPCRSELPYFNEAYEKYGDQIDFMMVDLADGQRETVEDAKAFAADSEYDFPLYFDTMGSGASTYGIMSIPTTICITSDGYIYSMHIGAIDQFTLNRWIGTLIEDASDAK